ncbi:TPA: hypothetical protein PXR45_002028 [Yersinia enterocolitica]|nr:hypothetical protein [Yersinia enterocolitica]HDL8417349.1 hypothetical protein [Yersinia enterocolitica]HDL8423760.1 hypothetical protein [Yersinia enterocolitica]HDM8309798.1 hypothetical protein [Yersinia enterocolitica]HDR0561558.1 hypothetical protein [Yersinia enterocolitica]
MANLKLKIEKAKILAYQGEVLLRASFDPDTSEDGNELSNLAFCKIIELREYLSDLMSEAGVDKS